MNCSRCENPKPEWNTAGYLICMNCGNVLAEPDTKREITHGFVMWAVTVKERLWRRRIADKVGMYLQEEK